MSIIFAFLLWVSISYGPPSPFLWPLPRGWWVYSGRTFPTHVEPQLVLLQLILTSWDLNFFGTCIFDHLWRSCTQTSVKRQQHFQIAADCGQSLTNQSNMFNQPLFLWCNRISVAARGSCVLWQDAASLCLWAKGRLDLVPSAVCVSITLSNSK